MALTARLRPLGFLAVVLLALTGTAQAQFPLTLETKVVEPKVAEAGSPFTLIVTSNGAINLSGITRQQVNFFDISPVSLSPDLGIRTRKVEATARKLTVTGELGNIPPPLPESLFGRRQMHVTFGDPSNFGDAIVTFTFTIVPPFVCPPSCQLPNICIDKKCVLPPTKCNPRCPVDQFCNEARKRCEKRPPS